MSLRHFKTMSRQTRWLVGWTVAYLLIAVGLLAHEIWTGVFYTDKAKFFDRLLCIQFVWILVTATPLIPNTRLNRWVFKRGYTPLFLIQERYTQQYVKAMGDFPLFTSDRRTAQCWQNLEEAKAHKQQLESRHSGPYDQYEIITIFFKEAHK